MIAALFFNICVRIGLVEASVQEFMQEESQWLLKTRKNVQEIGAGWQAVAASFAQQGHSLYRIGPNRIAAVEVTFEEAMSRLEERD